MLVDSSSNPPLDFFDSQINSFKFLNVFKKDDDE